MRSAPTPMGGEDHALWKTLCELGLEGLLVPESAGGLGLGVLDAAVIAEALGHHVIPAPFLGTAVLFPRARAVNLSDQPAWQDRLGAVVEGRPSRWRRLPSGRGAA